MALANGSRLTGNGFGGGGLRGNRFRGSAAFFALLLAGASGAAAEPPATDANAPDHTAASGHVPVRAVAPPAVNVTPGDADSPASKFSRRRLPLSRPFHGRSLLA